MCATGWTMKTEKKVPLSSKNSSVRLQSNRSLSEDSDEGELRENVREDWELKLVGDVREGWRYSIRCFQSVSHQSRSEGKRIWIHWMEPKIVRSFRMCGISQRTPGVQPRIFSSFFPKQEVEIKKWETQENEWREGFLFFPQVLMAFIHRPRPFRSLTLFLWSFIGTKKG